MKKRKHTPDQIIRKLREAGRLLAEGKMLPRQPSPLEVAESTYHRWRNQCGGMKANEAKRLKELERENTALQRTVADKSLGWAQYSRLTA